MLAGGDSLEDLKGLHISSLDGEKEQQNADDDLNGYEDADDEYDDKELEFVTLGFVEEPKSRWALLRQLFPSKAGGVPAWLDPINLPSGNSCLCDICGEPLQFLLQVYAPISEKEFTFHRMLYVFLCPSMTCLLQDQHEQWKRGPEKPSRSVKVFRCQLSLINSFYSSEPPRCDGSDKALGTEAPLCTWCGAWKGDKVCSSCRSARYCSEKHQVMHWRSGHKVECAQIAVSSLSYEPSLPNGASLVNMRKVASKSIWPEFAIIIEDECEFDREVSNADNHANLLVSREQMDETVESLLHNFEGNDERKSWATFQECVAKAPEQVLRYCRNAGSGDSEPLWPASSGRLSKADIPRCGYCGGAMCFEFQILPQLLYYFRVKNDVDSLDWATIVVYTCAASCEASLAYKEEFAWVQHSS
ncbi:hypothetical protein Nepgr_004432 [Nepenthes gracilis]|uniref:MYND-type domain-containing protein n=1 Tax=Nepenthes gracilis TaxID=150966 RepID=A0AAD3XF50_NEPGR|nr:hypothetical protein Nepgr_004432 [Nepenthes gracilis]